MRVFFIVVVSGFIVRIGGDVLVSGAPGDLRSAYLTLARNGSAEIEVKRSRFLCTLERVEDEAAARRGRRPAPQAALGRATPLLGVRPRPTGRGRTERSSDDGEPAGTAGAPMLEVLRGGRSDVVAVVTRWFGGTLLGAGGLVRAYGDAVRAGLEATGTQRRGLVRELTSRSATPRRAGWRASCGRGGSRCSTRRTPPEVLLLGVPPAEEDHLQALVAELSQAGQGGPSLGRALGGPSAEPRPMRIPVDVATLATALADFGRATC